MILYLVVGHRGVGKSSFGEYQRSLGKIVIDLDLEISRSYSQSPSQIFETQGEDRFRELEWDQSLEIVSRLKEYSGDEVFWVLGAGFSRLPDLLKVIKNQSQWDPKVLWIRRETDNQERFFWDRPRLKGSFAEIFLRREKLFAEFANCILPVAEGEFQGSRLWSHFKKLWQPDQSVNFGITVTPDLKNLEWNNLNAKFLEVRSDLFPGFEGIPGNLPMEKVLWSYRSSEAVPLHPKGPWDWDLELGNLPPQLAGASEPGIISFHPKRGSMREALDKLDRLEKLDSRFLFKFAPIVENWVELKIGWQWQNQNPDRRAFLPISKNEILGEPAWTWFRLWNSKNSPLNFFRLHSGSAIDQPTCTEVLDFCGSQSFDGFGAVLGLPVKGSFSPARHGPKSRFPFFRVPLKADDFAIALEQLSEFGLKFCAVTSPLKKFAQKAALRVHPSAKAAQAANTLCLSSETSTWEAHSTDAVGFEALLKCLPQDFLARLEPGQIWIWGGGGVLGSLVGLKDPVFFKARSGRLREQPEGSMPAQCRLLVLASAPNGILDEKLTQNPEFVLDLGYSQSSVSLGWAISRGLKSSQFIQGLEMFARQAAEQQNIWRQYGFIRQ